MHNLLAKKSKQELNTEENHSKNNTLKAKLAIFQLNLIHRITVGSVLKSNHHTLKTKRSLEKCQQKVFTSVNIEDGGKSFALRPQVKTFKIKPLSYLLFLNETRIKAGCWSSVCLFAACADGK